jgi:hypothetical protein
MAPVKNWLKQLKTPASPMKHSRGERGPAGALSGRHSYRPVSDTWAGKNAGPTRSAITLAPTPERFLKDRLPAGTIAKRPLVGLIPSSGEILLVLAKVGAWRA